MGVKGDLHATAHTSSLRVLDAAVQEEAEEWLQFYGTYPEQEVFAHPEYVRLFSRPCDRASCAIMRTAAGGILFPFLVRPLACEPWAAPTELAMDLISPYGYGGPYAWGCTEGERRAFWSQFGVWVHEHQIVCVFVRLSIFPGERLEAPCDEKICLSDCDQSVCTHNIVRSLDLDPDALLKDYDRKVPQNVNRALAQGLRFEVDSTGERLDDFLHVYYSTMDRHQAASTYYFPKEFFLTLCEKLPGRYVFFHVVDGSHVVSTELDLLSARRMYSFLGGTLRDAFPKRPNDFLKHQAALYGRETGKTEYVLGGGHGGDDSLYRYKKSFAPHGSVPYRDCRMIVDLEEYHRLVDQRRSWEASRLLNWQPEPRFFPEYRSELAEQPT